MTKFSMSDTSSDMGRVKLYGEAARIRFPDGTFENIDKVLRPGEDRSDFVREAAVLLIQLRESNPQVGPGDPVEFVDEQIAAAKALLDQMLGAYTAKLRRTPKSRK